MTTLNAGASPKIRTAPPLSSLYSRPSAVGLLAIVHRGLCVLYRLMTSYFPLLFYFIVSL